MLCGIAIAVTAFLLWRSERKQAAVGRRYVLKVLACYTISDLRVLREMQIFLVGYLLIEICEIFTVGKFPLSSKVRIVSGSASDL
jgi:Chitin synthase export chaperone